MWRLLALCVAMVSMAMAKNVHWEEYKEKHGLSFEDHEEKGRLATFEANRKFINKHNFYADLGKHSYWLGVNKFTHMTNKEYVADVIGGCLLDRNSSKSTADHVYKYDPNETGLNKTVDWRLKGAVTAVKNQEMCGSCWAFSTTGSLEGQWFLKKGKRVSLSEQNLVDCSTKYGNLGCGGGLMDYAFQYIKDNQGVDTEESYPYKGRDGKCHFNRANVGANDTGFVDIPTGDEKALEIAVAKVGPVSVGIDADYMSFYHSGVYYDTKCSSTQLDHGVLVVGYGTENGKDYWLVKNSWGAAWGDHGYIKMARNQNNMCGIATLASYPLV